MAKEAGSKRTVGKNVAYEVSDKNILTVTVDLNKKHGKSKSGKTDIVATTNGNTKIQDKDDNEIVIGINVYKYPEDEE